MTAEFENGREVKGTLIVGCDGPHSKVRDLLVGEGKARVTPLELVHSNTAVIYGDAEKAKFVRSTHPIFSMACHPDAFCFISSESSPPDDVIPPPPAKAELTRFTSSSPRRARPEQTRDLAVPDSDLVDGFPRSVHG